MARAASLHTVNITCTRAARDTLEQLMISITAVKLEEKESKFFLSKSNEVKSASM